MSKELNLIKTHLASMETLLRKYKYEGGYPNTQAKTVKQLRIQLIECEETLRMLIGNKI